MTDLDRPCGGRALLLIDFQHDFLADDGRMPVASHHVAEALAAAGTCVATATRAGAMVIKIGNEFKRTDLVRNLLRRNAAIEGSDGAGWDPRVDAPSAIYVPKWRGDAFCNPQLRAALTDAGVTDVAIAGLFAKACVTATARTAIASGFGVQLVADAIACRTDASRSSALAALSGLGARIVSSRDLWRGDGHRADAMEHLPPPAPSDCRPPADQRSGRWSPIV
jgi:nicotinamidase-related amidase